MKRKIVVSTSTIVLMLLFVFSPLLSVNHTPARASVDIDTLSPALVTTTSAVLAVHFDATSQPNIVHFRYGSSPNSLSSSTQHLVHYSEKTTVYDRIEGLSPDTTYYYQGCVSNDGILSCGDTVSFTTYPVVQIQSISSEDIATWEERDVSVTSAVLLGLYQNAIPGQSNAWFEYTSDNSFTFESLHRTLDHDSGFLSIPVHHLYPNTIYLYRFCVDGACGAYNGFTTKDGPASPDAPVIISTMTTLPAEDVTVDSAVFTGRHQVTNGAPAYFMYEPVANGSAAGDFDFQTNSFNITTSALTNTSVTVSGLEQNTAYQYQFCIDDSCGNVETFTTEEIPPELLVGTFTVPQSNVTHNTATVSGNYQNASSGVSQMWFEYGTHANNLNNTTNHAQVGASTGIHQAALVNLDANTTYYTRFCVDLVCGSTESFTTDAVPAGSSLSVETLAVGGSAVTDTAATLSGRFFDALPNSDTFFFNYGSDNTVVNSTSPLSISSADQTLSTTLTGLSSNSLYFYQACVNRSGAETCGSVLAFLTDEGVNTAPVVALNGNGTVFLNVGDTYNEQGAIYTDAEDGNGDVTNVSGFVDTANIGTYTKVYSYTDNGGLIATATRTIIVQAGDNNNNDNNNNNDDNNNDNQNNNNNNNNNNNDSGNLQVTTLSASDVDNDSARLRADLVNIGSGDVEQCFIYDTNSSDVNNNNGDEVCRSGDSNSTGTYTYTISNLDEDQKYYYRAYVVDDNGNEEYGSVRNFTTDDNSSSNSNSSSSSGLDINTLAASNVATSIATLRGDLVDNGAGRVSRWFEWDSSSSYVEDGEAERLTISGTTNTEAAFSKTITGLASDTEYFYRACGEDDDDVEVCGVVRSFTTASLTGSSSSSSSDSGTVFVSGAPSSGGTPVVVSSPSSGTTPASTSTTSDTSFAASSDGTTESTTTNEGGSDTATEEDDGVIDSEVPEEEDAFEALALALAAQDDEDGGSDDSETDVVEEEAAPEAASESLFDQALQNQTAAAINAAPDVTKNNKKFPWHYVLLAVAILAVVGIVGSFRRYKDDPEMRKKVIKHLMPVALIGFSGFAIDAAAGTRISLWILIVMAVIGTFMLVRYRRAKRMESGDDMEDDMMDDDMELGEGDDESMDDEDVDDEPIFKPLSDPFTDSESSDEDMYTEEE